MAYRGKIKQCERPMCQIWMGKIRIAVWIIRSRAVKVAKGSEGWRNHVLQLNCHLWPPDHTPPRLSETHAHTTSISCLSPSHTCSLCLKCLVTFPEWPCVLPFTRDHQWSGGGIDIPTSRTGNILRKMLVQLRIKAVTMQGKARKGLHPSNERSFHWSKQTNHKTLRSRLFWLEYISVASLPSSSQKCLKGYPSNLPGTICKRGFGFLSIKNAIMIWSSAMQKGKCLKKCGLQKG